MAFPQVAATNTSTEAVETGSHDVSLPASIAAGDLLIIIADFNAANGASPATPAGWDVLRANTLQNNAALVAYWREATGSEGATVVVSTGANDAISAHQSLRITGWTGTPESAAAQGTSSVADCPNLAPSWGAADTLWIAAASADNTAAITGTPANYGNAIDSNEFEAGQDAVTRTTRRELNAASDNPAAYSTSLTAWVAFTIAIQPSGVNNALWLVTA